MFRVIINKSITFKISFQPFYHKSGASLLDTRFEQQVKEKVEIHICSFCHNFCLQIQMFVKKFSTISKKKKNLTLIYYKENLVSF